RAGVSVRLEVLVRKLALPGVGHRATARHELITPSVLCLIEPAARGKFPLGFSWQFLSGPLRIRLGITVGDVHNRMCIEAAIGRARPGWAAPIGAELEAPPLRPIPKID